MEKQKVDRSSFSKFMAIYTTLVAIVHFTCNGIVMIIKYIQNIILTGSASTSQYGIIPEMATAFVSAALWCVFTYISAYIVAYAFTSVGLTDRLMDRFPIKMTAAARKKK